MDPLMDQLMTRSTKISIRFTSKCFSTKIKSNPFKEKNFILFQIDFLTIISSKSYEYYLNHKRISKIFSFHICTQVCEGRERERERELYKLKSKFQSNEQKETERKIYFFLCLIPIADIFLLFFDSFHI